MLFSIKVFSFVILFLILGITIVQKKLISAVCPDVYDKDVGWLQCTVGGLWLIMFLLNADQFWFLSNVLVVTMSLLSSQSGIKEIMQAGQPRL